MDDAFVIVQSWRRHKPRRGIPGSPADLEDAVGETMRGAGVPITVTTLTDVLAFGISSLTASPSDSNL